MAAGEIQTWFCAESWTYDVNGPRRGCSHRRIMVVIVAIVCTPGSASKGAIADVTTLPRTGFDPVATRLKVWRSTN